MLTTAAKREVADPVPVVGAVHDLAASWLINLQRKPSKHLVLLNGVVLDRKTIKRAGTVGAELCVHEWSHGLAGRALPDRLRQVLCAIEKKWLANDHVVMDWGLLHLLITI